MATKIIKNFSRGMTNDVRTDDTRYSQLIKNFDAHSYSRKLVPNITATNGDASSATNKIQNFVVAKYAANDYRMFGLGVASGGDKAKVFVNSSLNSATWTAHTNGEDPTDEAVDPEVFIYYANGDSAVGKLYGVRNGDTVWSVDPKSAATEAWEDVHTFGTVYENPRDTAASGRPYVSALVHSKDDILYIAHDYVITKYDGTTWTDAAITLPKKSRITSMCEYGNYLAIGVKSVDQVGGSQVYLWDRDSTLATLSEKIDWGEGNLQVLEEVGGALVGISTSGTAATVLLSRITFRYYAGGKPVVFNQFVSEEIYALTDLSSVKRKTNDYLHFLMKIKLGGTTHEGIWKVGRHIQTGEMVVSMAHLVNNGTALTGTNELHGFTIAGDTVFLAYTENNGLKIDWINGGSSSYTDNSTWETTILGGKDLSVTKKLEGITAMFEPLPAAGTITVKYKADAETTWTTIIDAFGTDDAIKHSAVNIESSGETLPQYNEIQFQVLSYGGAVPTGLKIMYQEIPDDIYG